MVENPRKPHGVEAPHGRLRTTLQTGSDSVSEAVYDRKDFSRQIAEMQHRVRNTLSVVRSIVRRTAEHAPSVEEFAAHLEGRIGALARGQSLVGATAGHGVDLELLINDEMLVHLAEEDRLRVAGPSVRLRAKTAETLALAFHELATNAVKFGALFAENGRVRVTWSVVDGPCLKIVWQESGTKVAALAPRRRGFGMELLGEQLP